MFLTFLHSKDPYEGVFKKCILKSGSDNCSKPRTNLQLLLTLLCNSSACEMESHHVNLLYRKCKEVGRGPLGYTDANTNYGSFI